MGRKAWKGTEEGHCFAQRSQTQSFNPLCGTRAGFSPSSAAIVGSPCWTSAGLSEELDGEGQTQGQTGPFESQTCFSLAAHPGKSSDLSADGQGEVQCANNRTAWRVAAKDVVAAENVPFH